MSPVAPPRVKIDSLSLPVVRSKSRVAGRVRDAGDDAGHDDEQMPLPMPYSSICSPSHIRKMVPAVIVRTAANPNQNRVEPDRRSRG